jgi:hypothetical protein
MVSMVEHEEAVFPFDVDDNSLPERHPTIVRRLGRNVGWASVLSPERPGVSRRGIDSPLLG